MKFGGYRYGIVGNGFVLCPQCEGVDVPLSCDYGGFPCYPATHPTNWCSRTCHLLFFYVCLKALIQKWTSHGQPSSIHTPMQTIEVPHPEMSLSGSLLPFSWSLSCNSNGRVHPIKSYEPLTFHRWVSTIRLISEATISNPGSDMNLDHNVCVYSIQQNQCVSNCFYVFFMSFLSLCITMIVPATDLRGVVLTRVLGRRGRGPVAVLQGAKMAIVHQPSWDFEPPETWELTQETRWHMEKSCNLMYFGPIIQNI